MTFIVSSHPKFLGKSAWACYFCYPATDDTLISSHLASMFEQHDAIVRLLRDNDPSTVSLLKNQLVDNGPDIISHLRELAAVDDATVSGHAHDILAEIESRQALDEFTLLCHLFADDGDVEGACWLLARVFLPGVEVDHYQRKLDSWGRQLIRLTASAISTRERVAILTNYLANDLGFRGNSEHYYDVHNSLLPSLIDSKMGIPISLAVLYIAVAGRAGIKVEGINLPGHFIVRHGGHFLRPVPPGKDPDAVGLRVDPAQAEAHLPAGLPRTGDGADDPDSRAGKPALHFPGQRRRGATRPRLRVAQGAGTEIGDGEQRK